MILKVKDVKKYFPVKGKKNSFVHAVDGVSFSVNKGETYGLVGESGCGKSTTARLMIRLLNVTSGSIEFDGRDISDLRGKKLKQARRNIQMVFQDPFASLDPRMTIQQLLMEPMKIYGIGTRVERVKKVEELLETVGLSKKFASRYPHEFSGGQRQRIGIARALVLNPELIILDEPVSALDVSIQSQILNLLKELQKEFDLTYVFISHDLSVIEYLCDRVAVMYLGKIVEEADKKTLFSEPRHPYTKALLSAIPIPDPTVKRERVVLKGDIPSPVNPPAGCSFHTRCPMVMDICKKKTPPLRRLDGGRLGACHLLEGESEETEKPVLLQ